MTENEQKAIRWMENIKDNAIVTLDHIKNEEPNVSPLVYTGRKERAGTILKMIKELQRYREIGTLHECRAATEKQNAKPVCVRERGIHEKSMIKEYFCPQCGAPLNVADESNNFKTLKCIFCPVCGQKLDW